MTENQAPLPAPDQRGWWWYRQENGDNWSPVWVGAGINGLFCNQTLMNCYQGSHSFSGQWIGPITPPTP